ncbi:MAG: hypothetical protein KC501_01430 [Myxococcales bacterium]|nr:hypothetical protein [Myxococcales bacterium]
MNRPFRPLRSLRPAPWCLALVALLGCRDDDRTLVPNRVLDRPLDVVLACVRDNGEAIEVLSLNECDGAASGRCSTPDSPTNQLIGFVANSERNELAMFRYCDKDSALVDLDREAPGYNFIPAGHLPSALTITEDSCRVLSANTGSCDLTVLDVAGFAAYAVDTPLSGQDAPQLPAASSLVSTLVPRRSDGLPLAASPGSVIAAPDFLSLASDGTGLPSGDTGDGGDDMGGSDDSTFEPGGSGGAADDGGATPDDIAGLVCDVQRPASVYVAFPSCQLVAEISIGTQTILQSRRFVTNADGTVEIIDTGTDPLCPVDCPAQLEGQAPEEIELVDPDGVFPTTLELVPDPDPDRTADERNEVVTYSTLFVGGPGSDEVYEIEIDEDGRFADEVQALPLEDAQGVHAIRATPVASVLGETLQYLYVIAGDGSTHVVRRDPDRGSLGVECDTQIDPVLEPPSACVPLDPGQLGNELSRRPFAVGPGIRAGNGVTVNDWVFHDVSEAQAREHCGIDETQAISAQNRHTPLCSAGVVGVGVTSLGTVVYSSFGQFLSDERVDPGTDPVGIMNVQVRPHSLWPAVDPFVTDPVPDSLPLVTDEEPGRALPGGGGDAQSLSPSLRRIDLAYATGAGVSEEQQAISDALGGVTNVDQLGSLEGEALYENGAPRVSVRDFQQWGAQTWSLEWEPTIPGTPSTTGLLQCDSHGSDGEPGPTCRNQEPDDARLSDESAAFCEEGVLAGDKLVLLGCSDDDSCGLGQRCLRDPTAPSTSTGICVSEAAYDRDRDALRDLCGSFIGDPCGAAVREYRITRATNDELWLAAFDQPRRTVVRDLGPDEADDPEDGVPEIVLREYETRLSCEAPIRHVTPETCQVDADCLDDPYDLVGDEPNLRGGMVCDLGRPDADGLGRCTGEQPDGGCNDDEDCRGLGLQYVCVDSLCRAPCDLCAPTGGEQPPRPCDTQFTVAGDRDENGNPVIYTQACLGADEVCIAGVCHQPCDDGSPGCLLSPLPGPACFPELTRYAVRLDDSFAFTGSRTPFLTDRVVIDPDTGECVEDPQVSNLLTSRIRLGADDASTFGTGPWQIPDCVNSDVASPDDPNPCRVVTERSANPSSLFHWMRYRGEPVSAIRYSNPTLSVVIDLTSLASLVSAPPDDPDSTWPASFARFLRARIPSGYREEFSTTNGFVPYNEPIVVGTTPLVYPVRIVRGPELESDFIVDAGGRGGVQGVRGQVVRIVHDVAEINPDQNFLVR